MDLMGTLADLIQKYFSFLSQMLSFLICICLVFIFIFAIAILLLQWWIQSRAPSQLPHLRINKKGERTLTVGFFHPYCNAGGGGERVLWVAVRALQQLKYSNIKCVIYTGDTDATNAEITRKAYERFNIILPSPVEFVYLNRRRWVEAVKYPMFTLLGQSLGSILLGWEAMMNFVPDVYIDSMGYAFTVPLFKYFGKCKVGCYVHYPTISTDMLTKVSQQTESYNNASFISRSLLLSGFKLQYYKAFAYLYGWAGKRCHFIMVNSSWTHGHITELWQTPSSTHIVFPPCDVSEFTKIPLREEIDSPTKNILSIAQFRPEKDHPLQIKAFHDFLSRKNSIEKDEYRLLLVGSCRNQSDKDRVKELKLQCKNLSIEDYVEFRLNVSFEDLKQLLSVSTVGLHTMWNEHFGIGVVELMAAGTIVLAHNSGGPKMDIVVDHNGQKTGFLAEDVASYSEALETIFKLTSQEKLEIRQSARESVSKFSEKEFEKGFLSVVEPYIEHILENFSN